MNGFGLLKSIPMSSHEFMAFEIKKHKIGASVWRLKIFYDWIQKSKLDLKKQYKKRKEVKLLHASSIPTGCKTFRYCRWIARQQKLHLIVCLFEFG